MADHQAYAQQIAIVGQGAIGGLIGFKCHQLGYPYHHLLRATHQRNLQVTTINGEIHNIAANNVNFAQAAEFTTLIVPVKAYQVVPVLEQLAPLIRPKHTLVLLHNGMGTTEQVKKRFPDNPLVVATTSYAAYKPNAGCLIETGLGQTHLGWMGKVESQIQNAVESMLSALLPPSTWHTDITLALWNKLVINAVINPLSAIYNIKNGDLGDTKYQATIADICSEISLVMNALQYNTSPELLIDAVNQVISATANNYSSMHQDIALNRPTEVDFINGYVMEQGKVLNIATPHNQRLLEQIHLLENT